MTLDEIAIQHGTDKSTQRHGYTRVYERYFAPLREKPLRLLEIGVQFGNSIRTWLDYFPNAKVVGLDIRNEFPHPNPRYTFILGSQADRGVLAGLGAFDVIIDDGGHLAEAQTISFDVLWPKLVSGGLYVIEDCFTWSDSFFGSSVDGYDWLSKRIGDLFKNGKQYHGKPHPPTTVTFNDYEQTIDFIHVYYGLVILGKK